VEGKEDVGSNRFLEFHLQRLEPRQDSRKGRSRSGNPHLSNRPRLKIPRKKGRKHDQPEENGAPMAGVSSMSERGKENGAETSYGQNPAGPYTRLRSAWVGAKKARRYIFMLPTKNRPQSEKETRKGFQGHRIRGRHLGAARSDEV